MANEYPDAAIPKPSGPAALPGDPEAPGAVADQGAGIRTSVVVCTHNRSWLLRPLVAALRRHGEGCEVLIVDSGSSDDTPAVVAALATESAPSVRTLRVERPSLSIARNRALAAARGDVIAYLDDDAMPAPGWLTALVAPFADARVGAVGGRVFLRFERPAPAWLTQRLAGYLTAYDLGPLPKRVTYSPWKDEYPRGANFALRRSSVRAIGGFRTAFGRRGRQLMSNEELDLCYRLERAGWHLRYAPDAAVDHTVLPERIEPQWFLRRFAAQGVSDAFFQLGNRGLHRALGRLRWHHGPHLLRSRYAPPRQPDPDRLIAECERCEAWGYVRGLVRGLPLLRTFST